MALLQFILPHVTAVAHYNKKKIKKKNYIYTIFET